MCVCVLCYLGLLDDHCVPCINGCVRAEFVSCSRAEFAIMFSAI